MRRRSVMAITLCLFFCLTSLRAQANKSSVSGEQTFSGALVDADCKANDSGSKCEIHATSKNFGIQTPNGKYLRLDDRGNARTRIALTRLRKKIGDIDRARAIKVTATGTLDHDTLKANAVELY